MFVVASLINRTNGTSLNSTPSGWTIKQINAKNKTIAELETRLVV